MYAERGETVPLPETGHLHILKTGYVYWSGKGQWDNKLKRTIDNRVLIGKLDAADSKRMYPNKRYFSLFGNEDPPGMFAQTLNYGPYYALLASAEKVGCIDVLREVFGQEWKQIFALAVHAVCAKNSVAQDFEFWAFHNYCGVDRNLDSKGITRVYEQTACDEVRLRKFMERFREEYDKRIPCESMRCVAFDSTNQNTTAKKALMAEYGHAKKKRGIPQINTALFVDEQTGIPLFYEHFLGSILDKSQTPYTIEKAAELGFQKLFVMMDRGYFAQQTALAMADLEFGVMAPKDAAIVTSMIEAYAAQITDREEYYIMSEDVYGIRVQDQEVFGGRYNAYLFYDPHRAQQEREQIHAKIRYMIEKAECRKRFTEKLHKQYEPWLDISKSAYDRSTGRNFVIQQNTERIQAEISSAGLFVIVSNADLSAADMIRVARMRDWGEKAFQRMKSYLSMDAPGTHSLLTCEGKMFVTFVALLVVEAYRWFMRGILISQTPETVATSLGELSKYQITLKADGTWMPVFAATRKQKQLLRALDRTEADIVKEVRALTLRV